MYLGEHKEENDMHVPIVLRHRYIHLLLKEDLYDKKIYKFYICI